MNAIIGLDTPALKAGMNAHLSKPIEPYRLYTALRE